MAKAHTSRNSLLPGGISRYSRSSVYQKRALYKRKKVQKKAKTQTKETFRIKPIGGEKNGKERKVPITRESRFYPTEDVRKPLVNRKKTRPTKLRKSLTPGTVVILLAGRHRGKRVVFLKQLPTSGLLLVTGPYKVNGVPLRRVPQSYVIATETKVDISKMKMPENIDDTMFARQKKQKKSSNDMFEESTEKYKPSEERISAQQTVDEQVLPEISKQEHLRKYMQQLFTLRKRQYPHEMKF